MARARAKAEAVGKGQPVAIVVTTETVGGRAHEVIGPATGHDTYFSMSGANVAELALRALAREAATAGADAVVGARLLEVQQRGTLGAMRNMVFAYGTAVRLKPT